MSRKSTAFITDEQENVLRFESAPEFMAEDDALDDVDHKVKEAQQQLAHLRQQQEEIERHTKHLEQLRMKQERFASGKKDLLEKLTRTTTTLDRELYDAQKLVEELSITRDNFTRHIEILRQLQPEKWQRSQVDVELGNALNAIEDAEDDYLKGVRRVASCRRAEVTQLMADAGEDEMGGISSHRAFGADDAAAWMRRGFAFTLPLMGALLAALMLARLMF